MVKALTKISPHYHLRYWRNEIASDTLKSLHAQDLSLESSKGEKKKSHFSHKPFLGEQNQKVLIKSFKKG